MGCRKLQVYASLANFSIYFSITCLVNHCGSSLSGAASCGKASIRLGPVNSGVGISPVLLQKSSSHLKYLSNLFSCFILVYQVSCRKLQLIKKPGDKSRLSVKAQWLSERQLKSAQWHFEEMAAPTKVLPLVCLYVSNGKMLQLFWTFF